jgi:bacterioferritin (cytochrome b1)
MKVELIEEVKYNETIYWVKVDGFYVANKMTYEEAKEEFEKASTFIPTITILETKEI